MEDILIGTTDRTITVFIPDPASTDGSGKTGLAHTDMTVSGIRTETDNDVVCTDYTSSLNALTNLTDAHNDWGWKEVSSTLCPGEYRLDIADALFASGAWYADVYVMITSSAAAATPKKFRLVSFNALDGVRGGLTALPNAAADAAGGLPISDTGGLDLDAQRTDVAAILVDTAEIGAAGAGLTNINLPNQTMDIVGNITGNLSGSVGSVTGAVGSVTGNVGGNVTGSVGSVATGGISAASFAAGAIDAAAIAADAIGSSELAASAVTEIQSGLSTLSQADVRTAVGLGSANLDTQLSAIAGYIDTEIGTLTTNLATATGYIDTEVAAIKAKTDNLPSDPADASDVAAAITAAWTTALTESYATDGSTATPAQLLYMLWSAVSEFSISGTTITAKKLDGSTTAMSFTIDSSTDPTSRTRAS